MTASTAPRPPSDDGLTAHAITKRFGAVHALRDVTLTFPLAASPR